MDLRDETSDDPSNIATIASYGSRITLLSRANPPLTTFRSLRSLTVHGARLTCIDGLATGLEVLEELNLSSNNIAVMEGLSHLYALRLLNLASNKCAFFAASIPARRSFLHVLFAELR